jgi:hypothetical protein
LILYGNDYENIPGKISEMNSHFIKIEFNVSKAKKIVADVPKTIIKSEFNPNSTAPQNFYIPLWFLRKHRIKSIQDDDIWE